MLDYSHLKIKTYNLWDLFLHEQQYPYIGRCYAWAKRYDAKQIINMNKSERDELFDAVIPAWDKAVAKLFTHDWPNIACLGNTAPHLHFHLIPRYHSARNIDGFEFVDPNPSGNYSPYIKKALPLEFLLKIKEDIKANI